MSLAILVSNDFEYQSLFVLVLFSSFSRFSGSVLGVKNSKKETKAYSSLKKLSAWGGDIHFKAVSEC